MTFAIYSSNSDDGLLLDVPGSNVAQGTQIVLYGDYHSNCGIESCTEQSLLPYCKVTCEKGWNLILLIQTNYNLNGIILLEIL